MPGHDAAVELQDLGLQGPQLNRLSREQQTVQRFDDNGDLLVRRVKNRAAEAANQRMGHLQPVRCIDTGLFDSGQIPLGFRWLVWRTPLGKGGISDKTHHLEGKTMATYVTLYNFTEQGFKNIKESVKRTEAAKKAAAANGMTVKEVLWVQGPYDIVVISEAPDETKANAFALSTLKMGNVRGQTLRAFTAAEMEKILEHVA